MDQELHLEIVYENHLDTDKFARMFNTTSQSYKFYWFEAILNLSVASEEDLTFEEIIDEMIEAFLLDVHDAIAHRGIDLLQEVARLDE